MAPPVPSFPSASNRREFLCSAASVLMARAAEPSLKLENEAMRLAVQTGPDGVYIAQFALNLKSGWPGKGFSANLLPDKAVSTLLRSGTAILVEESAWFGSRMPDPSKITSGPNWLRLEGIELGPVERPIAREEWRIELGPKGLIWRITRTFLETCRLTADRFPALVFSTHDERTSGYAEIPGFLDAEMLLDGIKGFPVETKLQWFEAVSPRREQRIHFSPSNIHAVVSLSAGFFNYAKAVADGTASAVTLGAESVDRTTAAKTCERGSVEKQEWSFVLAHEAAASLDVRLPDSSLSEQLSSFAGVYNQWMGWIFGNNPASTPCLHEMGWFPMIHGIQPANLELQRAAEKELSFFARTGVDQNGYVMPRWWIEGYYKVPWGNLHDQIPHFILAVYYHAVYTGNRQFVRSLMPVVWRVAHHLTLLDVDGDGVFEVPETSGLPNGKRDCSNWYDIIKFGHKDAYVNIQCVEALRAAAELAAWLGETEAAAEYRGRHARAANAHNQVFWNEAEGLYSDWIDVRGERRHYFYTDHNLMAIIQGVAGPERARRILTNLDEHYAKLCRDHVVARDSIYATPANMRPITQLGDMVDFGKRSNQTKFPNYENGCSFFHSTGFEIAARAVSGDPDGAYKVFERCMRMGYERNRLWAAALKWDTGELVSEPLCDSLLIAWGFLRGCFGAWPGLDDLKITGNAPAQMEGAHYRFCHLGKDVEIEVRKGTTRIRS